MKKILLLLTIICSGMVVNAQVVKKTEMINKATVAEQKKNPIKNFYGKKMFIAMHKNNDVTVAHTRNDIVVFHGDGKYEQSWNGNTQAGTWTYNESTNTVVINLNGANRYTVYEFTDTKLNLKKDNEILNLISGS